MRRMFLAMLALGASVLLFAGSAAAKVLLVGSYHGVRGQYTTIQSAVAAAKPGDWVLIGPGDYKTTAKSVRSPKGHPGFPAGVLITTPDVHIRGMNRNTVIVDGTKPGSAVCSRKAAAQNFGSRSVSGDSSYAVMAKAAADHGAGLNGVMVWKASNVSIQNLTACNFLGGKDGDGQTGNEVWWNGGAESGKVFKGHGFTGSYLNATSTYLAGKSAADEVSAAEYGIFSSNWSGGTWSNDYASNFNDSGFYIGACQQVCDQTMNGVWAEYNALGYSGSNSGGSLVTENSQFDRNEDGFDTNSQNGDNPPPQNGACPGTKISPITHTHSCWVFEHNYVHDNNNPNVPAAGSAAAGPVGTGMSLGGGRNDTIMDNKFVDNDAWGLFVVFYPDQGKPCTGGDYGFALLGPKGCLFDESDIAVLNNKFGHNGSYGHTTNGDFDQINVEPEATDCFSGNTEIGGGPLHGSDSEGLQSKYPSCNGKVVPANLNIPFFQEGLCDTQVNISVPGLTKCPTGPYPRVSRIVMHPLPTKQLKTMPNPCAGVPSNAWCGRRHA
jgi:hypothetical protein